MQPKRDPNDRRYWPARLGGTGQGFTYGGKEQSAVHYGSLSPQAALSHNPRPDRVTDESIAYAAQTVQPEAVKARARAVALRLLDGIDAKADSMVISDTLASLRAVAGFTESHDSGRGNGPGVTVNLGSLHLDALRAARPVSNSIGNVETVDAHILPNPANDNVLDAANGPDTDGAADQG